MSFDPREIPNNFRMQPFVEEGLAYAKALLESKSEADVFSTEEYVHLALIYLEEGKSWSKMEAFATLI